MAVQCSPAYLEMDRDTSQKNYSHSALPYEAVSSDFSDSTVFERLGLEK